MASTPSFMTLVVLLLGTTALLAWVVSRALEEQLLGRARQRAVRAAVKVVPALPPARVHHRS